ncbi:hypothetical protein V501_00188 [Pseudogymnoascus sp. VKM F-4519 (FW-2642)]|nr:hypothetical protein V501_00188 [Pseudogymnoascus sp. VKM F-4519 (FW-2642)]
MASNSVEVYDLLILVDATYSMSSYLHSLQTSLPQIISITTVTDCFSRIGLLAYRDYCDKNLLEWSGWLSPSSLSDEKQPNLIAKAKSLEPIGGGDMPEATKTGLARAYELMRPNATTIILLYTDAPPHTFANGSMKESCSHLRNEQIALSNPNDKRGLWQTIADGVSRTKWANAAPVSYGGFGHNFADWVSASKWLSKRSGDKKAQVFCILDHRMNSDSVGYYNYLSTMTGGACFRLTDSGSTSISQLTVEVLLAWMGVEKAQLVTPVGLLPAHMLRYKSVENIETLVDEKDPNAAPFFLSDKSDKKFGPSTVTELRVTADTLESYLPKKSTPVQDFAKRYTENPQYRKTAFEEIGKLIHDDVSAISLNPVFGSLWRVVSSDRKNPYRDEIITAFGRQVDKIQNADEKARMKIWLEESYDFTAEAMETIASVPKELRFPCVCLDPTILFTQEAEDDDEEENKPITSLQRKDLLEIGRSCDYRILRRLGRVLTRLTYINSEEEMPAHIAAASEVQIPRIPMALASEEYNNYFWRILLHIVEPGTMLSSRPAALLAALSIQLGLEPLLEVANREMLRWRDEWNDLDIPETWNTSCLGLLLDADDAYQKREAEEEGTQVSINPHCEDEPPAKRLCHENSSLTYHLKANETHALDKRLLNPQDRALFERLVSYKMLEFNLETTLRPQIGWTPEKTTVAMGPTVICVACEYPRSITIMGVDGKCGKCLWNDYATPKARQDAITVNATKQDDETTPITWVECGQSTCRAQYVVYNPAKLSIKPKCHYCREHGKAPVLECSKCLNRVIWPEAYRPADMGDFACYACTAGVETIVGVETNALEISKESNTDWLLRNEGNKISAPFTKRSLFKTITEAGIKDFVDKVEPLPSTAQGDLTLHGKLIRNTSDIVAELRSWIIRRKTESGTCSLCFVSFKKCNLIASCGRTGCSQRVCKGCLAHWYGLNVAGGLINIAALSCAFCRRRPVAKTFAKHGFGIHAVAGLENAVKEAGEWIYAWCEKCGVAKQYMQRVCANGAPEEVKNWKCGECVTAKEEGRFKACPGCTTMVEKVDGCDHITCTVEGCETEWCFVCRGVFDEETIYGHMEEEHGGYGDEVEDF